MALINAEQFNRIEKNRNTIHKPVAATFTVFKKDGHKYFQIDTYGTAERVMLEKVSQSIQLNKSTAEKLINILQNEFSLV
jgi:hypothetical protein